MGYYDLTMDEIRENLEPWIWDQKLVYSSPLSVNPEACIAKYYSKLSLLSQFRWGL
jgi:hypothetical protein